MDILSIEISGLDNKKFGWQARKGQGAFRKILCLKSSSRELHLIQDFLKTCMASQAKTTQFNGSMVLADPNGDLWTIELKEQRRCVYLNNQKLEPHKGWLAFNKILTENVDPNSSQMSFNWCCHKIIYMDQTLKSLPFNRENTDQKIVLNHIQGLWQEKKQELGLNDSIGQIEYIKIINEMMDIHHRYLYLKNLKTKHDKKRRQSTKKSPTNYQQIQIQLDYVQKIESNLKELNTLQKEINAQKKQLISDEAEIKKWESNALGGLALDRGFLEDWPNIINIFTRIKFLEHLGREILNESDHFHKKVIPIFTKSQFIVKDFLTKEGQLMRALQGATNTLHTLIALKEFQNNSDDPAPISKPQISPADKIFNKFFPKNIMETKEESNVKELVDKIKITDDQLLNTRDQIEQTLDHLLKVANHLNLGKRDKKRIVDAIQSLKERQAMELEKFKKQWRALCQKYQLPQNLQLKNLIEYVQSYYHIQSTEQRIKEVRGKIAHRHQILEDLRESVCQWRQINQSQKSDDLVHVSLLISEAKSILKYKNERHKTLSIFVEERAKVFAEESLSEEFNHEIYQAFQQWKNLADKMDLNLNLDDKNTPIMMARAQELCFLEAQKNSLIYGSSQPAFSIEGMDHSLNLWILDASVDKHHDLLTTNMGNIDFKNINIFVTQNPSQYEGLVKLGCSQLTESQPLSGETKALKESKTTIDRGPTLQRRTSNQRPSSKSQNEMMSEKAKNVLEIFQKKSGMRSKV